MSDKPKGTAVIVGSVNTAAALLEAKADQLAGLLPTGVRPERFAKVVLQSIRQAPGLLACTQASFVEAALQCAALGLEPARGQAYLIPYKDHKRNVTLAQFQLGWQGMLELAMRSGEYGTLEAHVVRDGDVFRVTRGLHPDIVHEPRMDAEVGPLTHVYAVAWPSGKGMPLWEVMNRAQVDAIRQRSKAKGDGPWVTDYDEMGRKTVLRRLSKWLRLSPEVADAFERDAVSEYGKDGAAQALGRAAVAAIADDAVGVAQMAEVLGEEAGPPPEPTATDNLADELEKRLADATNGKDPSGGVSAGVQAKREAEKKRQKAALKKAQVAPETSPTPSPTPTLPQEPGSLKTAPNGPKPENGAVELAFKQSTATRLHQGMHDEYPGWVGEIPILKDLKGVLARLDHPDTIADMWYRDGRNSAGDLYHTRLLSLGVARPEALLEARVRAEAEAAIIGDGPAKDAGPTIDARGNEHVGQDELGF